MYSGSSEVRPGATRHAICLVSPDGFGIPFLCRLRGTCVIALTWAGTEGEDSYLLVADSGNVFRSVATSYRYWVPE